MSIEELCEKYEIVNYTINSDKSIDVNGNVELYNYGLFELPLTFGKVTGFFDCSNNKLISLSGSPKQVDGNFNCNNNYLTNLKGSPKQVDGDFDCSWNKLTSLKGCPEKVGKDFYCFENPKLSSLEGDIKSLGLFLYCYETPLESIFNIADIDFIIAFKTFKVIQDGVINLKRLKYVMEMFNKPVKLEDIKKYYTIK
jgi:hypothetical protein